MYADSEKVNKKAIASMLGLGILAFAAYLAVSLTDEYQERIIATNNGKAEQLGDALVQSPFDVLGNILLGSEPATEDSSPESKAGIQAHLSVMKLTEVGEQLFLNTNPQILSNPEFGEACRGANWEPGVGILGCYYPVSERIYIYDITDNRLTSLEPVISAHEMLHAAWYALAPGRQTELTLQLSQTFNALPESHPIRERLRTYMNSDAESVPTELHSILGTELEVLPEALENHYRTYFTDRNKIVELANSGYRVIREAEQEAESLGKSLRELSSLIDQQEAFLKAEKALLETDTADFNARASQPGGFASEDEYNSARELLEKREVSLSDGYNTFHRNIDLYNLGVGEINDLNKLLRELNKELNIPERLESNNG